jgi:hypothetical protein
VARHAGNCEDTGRGVESFVETLGVFETLNTAKLLDFNSRYRRWDSNPHFESRLFVGVYISVNETSMNAVDKGGC